MIIQGSRYTASLDYRDGDLLKVAIKGDPYTATRVMTIITKEGDTFDKVASRTLGDASQYWKIAGLNPNIRFPDQIPAGTVLLVPVV